MRISHNNSLLYLFIHRSVLATRARKECRGKGGGEEGTDVRGGMTEQRR